MKKRILALLLAVCIAASMLVLPASAAATNNTAVQMAITLGAMDTDQTGALNAVVTRGSFARMLTSFSTFRESVGAQGTVGTLYTDVPGTSPWAPYIRIAVQQGWLNGYTDGSYRPDNAVTLEEACTAVLKLMGYKMTELNGAFPNAQLNKASEIGLRTGLDRKQGEAMNYEDAAVLLYNALTANTASGGAYGTTLGFTVSNGQVDASTVLLSSLQGPFIYGEGAQVPFTPVTVYRNDKVSPSGELNQYDVYYYSESLRTVWVYTRRAAGRITAVSPSASAPTSVTVAGSTYTLGSTAVASQVSSLNGGGVGQVVTLLLGMNNEVAGIVTGEEADSVFYGVVQSASRNLIEEDNGADVLQKVSVMCTDGIVRSVNVDKSLNFPTGWLVEISVDGANGENVKKISTRSVSGTVNADATALGDAALADDVEIMDTTSGGAAGAIRPSRLSGVTLSGSDVRYYTTNENGQIDRLILSDVTGDLWEYAALDGIQAATDYAGSKIDEKINEKVSSSSSTSSSLAGMTATTEDDDQKAKQTALDVRNIMLPSTSDVLYGLVDGSIVSTTWNQLTGSTDRLASYVLKKVGNNVGGVAGNIIDYFASGANYVCYVNGKQVTYTTSVKYPVIAGGVAIGKSADGKKVNAMVQLSPVVVDKLGASWVMKGDTRYETADDIQVYLWNQGTYYKVSLADLNPQDYKLIGWYDNQGHSAGNKIRLLVAVRTN